MTDIDAIHPILGHISPQNTPQISERFETLSQSLFKDHGIGFGGSASEAWIDNTSLSRLLATKLGLEGPMGYLTLADYTRRLKDVSWDLQNPHERLLAGFVDICIQEELDIYFT